MIDLQKCGRILEESLPFGVWVCAPDGSLEYASPSFLKLVGLTLPQCRAYGWTERMAPEDAYRYMADWQWCRERGAFWDYEYRIKDVDGVWHAILCRGVPFRNESGHVEYWAGINLDVTERKRVEAERSEHLDRLY
jgi:PAS domain S-box-containing protein